jgi:hypothetical protein
MAQLLPYALFRGYVRARVSCFGKKGCCRMAGVSVSEKYATAFSGYETGCLRPGAVFERGGASVSPTFCRGVTLLKQWPRHDELARELMFLLYIKTVNSLKYEKESKLCHCSENRSPLLYLR